MINNIIYKHVFFIIYNLLKFDNVTGFTLYRTIHFNGIKSMAVRILVRYIKIMVK